MARTYLRLTACVGTLGLGLMAMSPAVAATENQAGASALTINVANQGAQGTGLVTAKYADGKETKTGDSEPAIPAPANGYLAGGVLAQEATAKPGFSAACAGLAGDGGSVLNIGDSSCLKPANLVSGSLGDFDLSKLFDTTTGGIVSQLPAEAQGQLGTVLGGLATGADTLNDALDPVLSQLKTQFGDAGLVANLDLIEGRCTAGDGGPTGTSTLTDAKIQLKAPGQDPITILSLPVHPKPNTHLFTNLSDVLNAVLDGVDSQLNESINGALGPATAATAAIRENIVEQIHKNAESNFSALEDNVLDVILNEQEHPTADSIKVRALHAKVIPATEAQVGGSLIDLQIGDAACAPVAQAAVVSPPQAATPQVAAPRTPTGVSAGLATMPGHTTEHGIDASTWALMALAGLGLVGSAVVGIRRVVG